MFARMIVWNWVQWASPSVVSTLSVLQEETIDLSLVSDIHQSASGLHYVLGCLSFTPSVIWLWDQPSGTSLPQPCLFSLSAPEWAVMEKYFSQSLAAGIIHPCPSPAGAGFSFVKMYGSLHLCIDYWLNDITIKNRYPSTSYVFSFWGFFTK